MPFFSPCEARVHHDESSVRQVCWEQCMDNANTTYQGLAGTLEHIANVLAQPRLWGLPTDETKVINVLYALDKREEEQHSIHGNTFFQQHRESTWSPHFPSSTYFFFTATWQGT